MVQKTETDYETVEKTIEVTYCDVCGMDYDDEEIAQVAINPETQPIRALQRRGGIPSYIENGLTIGAYPDGSPRRVGNIDIPEDGYRAFLELKALRKEVQEVQNTLSNTSSMELHTDGMCDVCRDCLEASLGVETVPTKETNFQVVEQEPWTKSRVRQGAKWLFGSTFGAADDPAAMLILAIFVLSWVGALAAAVWGSITLFVVPFAIGVAAAISLLFYILETTL